MKLIRSREVQTDAWHSARESVQATLLVWSTGAVVAGILGTPHGVGTVVHSLIVGAIAFTIPAVVVSSAIAYLLIALSYGHLPNFVVQIIAAAAAATVLTSVGAERRTPWLMWTMELVCMLTALALRHKHIRSATR